jgi:hypothetical protein
MTIFKNESIDKNSNLYELYKIKDELITYVNNIENVYKTNDVNILISSTPDIIKYYDIEKFINNNFDKYLYLPSNSKFINPRFNKYLKQDNENYSYKYLDLELLNKYPIKSQLLNYLNNKYNKDFTNVYLEPPYSSPLFNIKISKIIDDYKWTIYNYLMMISFFIFIILHSLYLSYNINIVYIYITTIILGILILSFLCIGYLFSVDASTTNNLQISDLFVFDKNKTPNSNINEKTSVINEKTSVINEKTSDLNV